jgi:hypothetical protein
MARGMVGNKNTLPTYNWDNLFFGYSLGFQRSDRHFYTDYPFKEIVSVAALKGSRFLTGQRFKVALATRLCTVTNGAESHFYYARNLGR